MGIKCLFSVEEAVTLEMNRDVVQYMAVATRAAEKEYEAHMEEMEHMNNWAELRMEEEAIKSAIKELKDLNKELDDLNTMRNNLA